tara:strand:- start:58 stop:381 length:324 start_codon:yes stop_codon:yes gene_type:complete
MIYTILNIDDLEEEIERDSEEGSYKIELKYIVLSDCLQTSWDTTKKSLDGTKALFKFNKDPNSLQVVSGAQTWLEYLNAPFYSYDTIRNILAGSDWIPVDFNPYGVG